MITSQIIQSLAYEDAASPIAADNSLYFRMRVTGTGMIDREATGQMYRTPSEYLNSEFMQACLGVPVIYNHPEEGGTINPANAVLVGTIIYAYIHPKYSDEVWCIARIIRGQIQLELLEQELSTSPSVVTEASYTDKYGRTCEGKPIMVDHLAICPLGVWDKGGPPAGIDQTILDETEAESVVAETIEEATEDISDAVVLRATSPTIRVYSPTISIV